jgi:multiple sugar transport system ATP-binding protein
MSSVELVGLSKRYEGARTDRAALQLLDLTIKSGEFVVLVGPSGCGKSTTLRIVAGLEEPTTGRVFIDSRDVTNVQPAQRDIAMVFQSYALYPHMSVFDNLAFALRMRKVPAADIRARVEAVARALEIEPYLDRKPKALSGGQRQRVAIGRAMVREPKVFLFDEPLSNLDAKLRGEMRREIARIHAHTRTTCVYVTHDQIEAMTLADRIVVLRDGMLQQVGTPMDIYDTPANRFVAGFFGTPAMNFLPARVDSGEARGQGFAIPLGPHELPADKLIVGIRPESLALREKPEWSAHPYREGLRRAVPLAASVDLREVLGAEVVLHLSSEAGALTVRAPSDEPARKGDNLTVWLDHAALHLFDADSELRLQ